jgi:glycosyltransferase involved in cell wall biosynthesis
MLIFVQDNMKILFVTPYPPGEAPSQRFRFEQYFEVLIQKGFSFSVQSFLSYADWNILYGKSKGLAKVRIILTGFIKRFFMLFKAGSYDFIFIHREAAFLGPPVVEWILANVLKKKIIYDFDDAIWLTDQVNESRIKKIIRWRSKVKSICKWSYKVSCGNEYLCSFARKYAKQVAYNPTTIDTTGVHIPATSSDSKKDVLTLGWTGSHSTLKYLKAIEPVLVELEKKYPNIEILIIANRKPALALRTLKFLPWRKESESEDLSKMDIGIMPLPDDEWTKGKCGFKALQYMAMKIPAVVSPVGVNLTIVDHGINGFHAATHHEWLKRLEELINDTSLREKMGKAGREKVINEFSVESNQETFLKLFE